MKLYEFIQANATAIMEAWEKEARSETPPAAGLERLALLDHLPELLRDFADEIRTFGERPSLAERANTHADEHAWERIEQGYLLEHVVRELALLRSSILRLWRTQFPTLDVDDAEVLARVVERAMERSVSRYFERRSQLLTAMEQIADAAFNLENLPAFLQGLLQIFLRFAPSIDSATILLREEDQLTVHAAMGLEEEVRRHTERVGEGFAGTIAATGKPLLLRRAWEDPLVHSASIRERKTLALYGVPLRMGDELIGVAHIGSRLSENISEPERRLFAALAQRATSAIAKHQLRIRAVLANAELRAVIEAIPSPAFVGNHAHMTLANAAGLRMLGFPDEASMRRASIADMTARVEARNPETGARMPVEETPFAVAAGGEPSVREVVHRIDGEDRILRGHAGPIRVGGATVGAAIVLTDVTELHNAVKELKETADFRERFVGIVSHDLRSPLSAIGMSAGLLVRSPELAPSLAKPAGRILSNVDRMAKMIADLLDFTRGRLGGGIPVNPERTNLAHVVRRVLEEFEQTHPNRPIEYQERGDTHGEWDPERLAQVVQNLVVNAMQYGSPQGVVQIFLEGARETATLAVHNAGAPIPANILPHIFSPFRRGRAGDKSPAGLGLGLFIAAEITRSHRGTIQATSDEGGTTFTVTLPRCA